MVFFFTFFGAAPALSSPALLAAAFLPPPFFPPFFLPPLTMASVLDALAANRASFSFFSLRLAAACLLLGR